MKATFKEKLRYRFEKYLNKGGFSIFVSLFVLFIALFLLIVFIRWMMLLIWPDLAGSGGFFDGAWLTWLQMTDPGNMLEDTDSGIWLKIVTVLAGVFGVILLSILIAFITTSLEKVFYNFRKGRGKVIEEDHTIILGWNERVVDIIRELVLANESEKDAAVVILADHDKEVMDDMVSKRLLNKGTSRVITTTGDFANINELNRIGISQSRSVILLASCTESASEEDKSSSDVQSIKAIMAIIACQDGKNQIPIIAEIFSDEKRELIGYFEDNNIIALDSWNIMGKLLVQTSLTSGLEMVYAEILSFDGGEVYFYKNEWRGLNFGELPYYFKDGIPLGVYNQEDGLTLRPGKDYGMKTSDHIVILAEDDSTINFEANKIYEPSEISFIDNKLDQKQKRVLILGWHSVAEIFISEAYDYLKAGSDFNIVINEPSVLLENRVGKLKKMYPDFEINLTNSSPLRYENLKELEPFSFDNIIILSQNVDEKNPDKIDSDTLIILLLLRNIKPESTEKETKIITQILNSENQEIITQTDVDDFIISNKLITMILAQLSEQPLIKKFYDDIFSEDGSEIYVKPIDLYTDSFPLKTNFGDLIKLVDQRDEVCLGIRIAALSKDSDKNFGVTLNLPKDKEIELTASDFLVVLSEDEL